MDIEELRKTEELMHDAPAIMYVCRLYNNVLTPTHFSMPSYLKQVSLYFSNEINLKSICTNCENTWTIDGICV